MNSYNVCGFNDVICQPTDLKMACIAGESDTIINLITVNFNVDKDHVNQVVKLLIDFDHSKCLTALLSSYAGDIVKKSFEEKHLRRACKQKSIKILDVILKTNCFNINEEHHYLPINPEVISSEVTPLGTFKELKMEVSTLLDSILKDQTNNEYDQVILVLRQHGAKTADELKEMPESVTELIMTKLINKNGRQCFMDCVLQ